MAGSCDRLLWDNSIDPCLDRDAAGVRVKGRAKPAADRRHARGYAQRPSPSVAIHLSMQFSRTRLATRRLVGVALLAMLLGQWSVLVHSIAHARALEVVEQSVDGDNGHDHGWGHQAGTSACHLVDHLLTGQTPGSEPTVAVRLPPKTPRFAARAASNAPGPTGRAYEARGPPRA